MKMGDIFGIFLYGKGAYDIYFMFTQVGTGRTNEIFSDGRKYEKSVSGLGNPPKPQKYPKFGGVEG